VSQYGVWSHKQKDSLGLGVLRLSGAEIGEVPRWAVNSGYATQAGKVATLNGNGMIEKAYLAWWKELSVGKDYVSIRTELYC
jgi:hypothetical protein